MASQTSRTGYDRRILNRFRTDYPIRLLLRDHRDLSAKLLDISPSGLKVGVEDLDLRAGEHIQVIITPPRLSGIEQDLTLDAEVIRCLDNELALSVARDQLSEAAFLLSALLDSGAGDPQRPL